MRSHLSCTFKAPVKPLCSQHFCENTTDCLILLIILYPYWQNTSMVTLHHIPQQGVHTTRTNANSKTGNWTVLTIGKIILTTRCRYGISIYINTFSLCLCSSHFNRSAHNELEKNRWVAAHLLWQKQSIMWDKNRRQVESKWARALLFYMIAFKGLLIFLCCSDIPAKERTVWYSFTIAAVFLEDTQTFPQSAEGTICFQTTGLLPDTLPAWRNSSFLLFLHNETCPFNTLQMSTNQRPAFLETPKGLQWYKEASLLYLFEIKKRCCMLQDERQENSADLSSFGRSICNFSGVRRGWRSAERINT